MTKLKLAGMAFVIMLALHGVGGAAQLLYTDSFIPESCGGFSATGTNPFFVLQPGYRSVYRGMEGKEAVDLRITVLNETKLVGGIRTRVVEERELHDGELAEVSRNYFAICNRNNSVFYFGEDVDNYEGGQVVNHSGSWLAGMNGARAGVLMPGIALIGSRYMQEIAPPVALDRAEIVSLTEVVQTPAGTFPSCLKTDETTELEPGKVESKWYAPGIGLVQDDALGLVSAGF